MGRYVFQILFVVMLIMSTSCTAMYHGFSTKVTLESQINYGSSDTLKLVAEGSRKTKEYNGVVFPYVLKVRHNNMPVRTSLYRNNVLSETMTIHPKRCGVGVGMRCGWFVGGGIFLSGAVGTAIMSVFPMIGPIFAMYTLPFFIIGGTMLGFGFMEQQYIPEYKYYKFKSVTLDDHCTATIGRIGFISQINSNT